MENGKLSVCGRCIDVPGLCEKCGYRKKAAEHARKTQANAVHPYDWKIVTGKNYYDLAVVPVRADHLPDILPVLAANHQIPNILVMVNNPKGPESSK